MGVLSSLVAQAQPALYGGGVTGSGTAGATWLWPWAATDSAGELIDMTGVTAVAEIVSSADAVIETLDFVGAVGSFTIGKDEADTAVLTPAKCRWRLSLDDGDDVVQVYGGASSKFNIVEA